MEKINPGGVLKGGAFAAITFALVEIVLEGAVSLFGLNEAELFREAYPDIVMGGTVNYIWNVVHLFVLMSFAIWIYAAIRPRFGPGPKCALIVSFVLWFTYLLIAMNFVRHGILPANIAIVSLAFNLIEIPAAVLVGARIYSEPAA